jgi:glycerate kinase
MGCRCGQWLNGVKSQGYHLIQSLKYRITDIQGKKVLNGLSVMNNLHKINISALKPGIYLIRIENGEHLTIEKIVKQ